MKKGFYLLPALMLSLVSLSGCQSDNRITLIYRSWDTGTEKQNNEERQLIKAFEDKEGVRIKVVESPGVGSDYETNIKASLSTKLDLADVVNLTSVSFGLSIQYCLNIKEFVENDPEFQKIPEDLRESCKFKSGYYAVPARLNMQGYFANTTIINSTLNIETDNLGVDSSFSELEAIIDAAAKEKTVVGVDTTAHFIDTMASAYDETGTLGYFSWDGEKYNLDSDAFIRGVQKGQEIFAAGKTLASYSDEQKDELGIDLEAGDHKVDAWNKGLLALRYGYTYEAPDMVNSNENHYSYKFIGNPGGKLTVVGDFYGIYKNTEHPELAYKFAKWMGFGKEGFQKRMEIYKTKGTINSLPIQQDNELVKQYFRLYGDSTELSGLEEAYNYMEGHYMLEGTKVIPGYRSSRYDKNTGVTIGETTNATMFQLLNACIVGGENIANYTSGAININTLANKGYTDTLKTYEDIYE